MAEPDKAAPRRCRGAAARGGRFETAKSSNESDAEGRRLRVALVYPYIAHYRGPVMEELLQRSENSFVIVADSEPRGGIPTWPVPESVAFRRARFVGLFGHDLFQTGVALLPLRRDVDAVICLGNARWISTWLCALLARLRRKRVLFWTHGWLATKEAWPKGVLRRVFYRLADGLLLYGRRAKTIGVSLGFSPERLYVVNNSLDFPRHTKLRQSITNADLVAFRRSTFGNDEVPVVVCSTRMTASRRLDLLLQAVAQLAAEGHNVNVMLIGDGPCRDELAQFAAAHHLPVHMFGQQYEEEFLARATMAANVSVVPSRVGLAAIQSLGFGTPVITHDDPNEQGPEWEAIVPGVNGDYYRKGNVEDLAARISAWTQSPWCSQEVREACVETISASYTPEFQRRVIDHALRGEAASTPVREDVGVAGGEGASSARPAMKEDGRCTGGAMPIAYVSNGVTPYGLNLAKRIVRELPALRVRFFFTHEFSMNQWPYTTPSGVDMTVLRPASWSGDANRVSQLSKEWRLSSQLLAQLAQMAPCAVVVLGYADIASIRTILWCRRHGVPCFVWGDSNLRGEQVRGLKRVIKRLVLRRLLGKTAGALVCGTCGRDYFVRYGVPMQRVFYVPNEPDFGAICDCSAERSAPLASRFGVDLRRRRILFAGRLVGIKRVDLLIDSFSAIAQVRPEWDVLVVGDGPERNALQCRVPEALRARFIWTGFVEAQSEISALYHLCDVLVVPSDREAWSVVLTEAVAAGLAVVASDQVGAAVDLVSEGVNGFLFPAGDVQRLGDALLAATDPERLPRLQGGAAAAFGAWRASRDPVEGLRAAFRSCGVRT